MSRISAKHKANLIAQAKATEPTRYDNGRSIWIIGDHTVRYNPIFEQYTVTHTPITYANTKPGKLDWTHHLVICDMYEFRVYPLPTGGEVRVPINDAAIQGYEAGKAEDDGLYVWEWLDQWMTEQEASLIE